MNVETRRARQDRAIIVGAIAFVVLAVIGLTMPIPFVGRASKALGDLCHAPLFGALALFACAVLDQIRPTSSLRSLLKRTFWLMVALNLFGVIIELVQQKLGRTASVQDMTSNALGTVAGLLCYWYWRLARVSPQTYWLPRMLLVLAGFLLAFAWWTPMSVLRDVATIRWGFPRLASFETPVELQRFYFRECGAGLSRQDATDGSYSMEVSYLATEYPAATLIELRPDWSSMQTLEMDVVLDRSYSRPSVELMIKVRDRVRYDDPADTYRGKWTLIPGEAQRIRIPRDEVINGPDDRQLDLTQIKYVDLMLLEPGELAKVRFDSIRLTTE